MKKRPEGFLAESILDDPEVFDYIRELHDYLWRFVRAHRPGASGHLRELVDPVLGEIENGD